jgi:urease subunit beta
MIPGEVLLAADAVVIGPEPDAELDVLNAGDRPIQVGSHYHFAESNPALRFDRAAAWGMRLAIPAGTSVRFEPGIERRVALIALRGARRVLGLRGAVGGSLDDRTAP